MKKIIIIILSMLIATAAMAQAPQTLNAYVSGLPTATGMTGSESLYCIQGGQSKQCTTGNFTLSQTPFSAVGNLLVAGPSTSQIQDVSSSTGFNAPIISTGSLAAGNCLNDACSPINQIKITSSATVFPLREVDGLDVSLSFGGGAATGNFTGLSAHLAQTATTANTNGNYVGMLSIATADHPDGPSAAIWGGNDNVYINNLAAGWLQVIGREIDVAINGTTATSQDLLGLQIVETSIHNVLGSRSNIGITLNNGAAAATYGYDCMVCAGNYAGYFPMNSNGTILGAWAHAVARNGSGQAVPSTNAGTTLNGVDFRNVTFTGKAFASNNFAVDGSGTMNFSGVPMTLQISPSSTGQTNVGGAGGGTLYENITTDHSTWASTGERPNCFYSTLSPSVNTTKVWENFYTGVTLNGPGQQQAEINQMHAEFTAASGAVSTSDVENYEARIDNSGSLNNMFQFLATTNHLAGGTVTQLFGLECRLSNANATAGAIGSFACINNEVMLGGGSVPSFFYLMRNAEPRATIATLGTVNIGTLSPQGIALYVAGPDTSGGTPAVKIADSSSNITFMVKDDGSVVTQSLQTSGNSSYINYLTIGGSTTGVPVQIGVSGTDTNISINLTPKGSGTVKLPTAATGTPTASLCLDAGGNIIKKTTAGSCI